MEIGNSRFGSWIMMSSVSHWILDCDAVGFPLSAAPVQPAEGHADRHGVRPGRGGRTPTPTASDPGSARPRRPSSIEERNEEEAGGGEGGGPPNSGGAEPGPAGPRATVQESRAGASARASGMIRPGPGPGRGPSKPRVKQGMRSNRRRTSRAFGRAAEPLSADVRDERYGSYYRYNFSSLLFRIVIIPKVSYSRRNRCRRIAREARTQNQTRPLLCIWRRKRCRIWRQ